LENIETDIAVGEVDETAIVDLDIVRLRARPAAARLGDKPGDLARRARIGEVGDAQPAAEPGAVDEAVVHALGELVHTEAPAGSAAVQRIELADLEHRQRLDLVPIA